MDTLRGLPTDRQCQALRGPVSLHEYLKIRQTSQVLFKRINACLEELSNDEEGQIEVETVLGMKRIKKISLDSPIVMTTTENLLKLAQHPTLDEASIDLSIATEGDVNLFIELIKDFFGSYRLLPEHDFNFIFILDPESLAFIQVTNRSLYLYNLPEVTTISSLYAYLGSLIAIEKYTGDLNYNLDGLLQLTNLKEVNFNLRQEDTFVTQRKFIEWFIQTNILESAEEFYISYPQVDPHLNLWRNPYLNFNYDLMRTIENERRAYPNVKTFLPINYVDSTTVQNAFPNVTSIWLSIVLLEIEEPQGGDLDSLFNYYQEVVIVNDTTYSTDEIKERILPLFTTDLHDRITITVSNWLE